MRAEKIFSVTLRVSSLIVLVLVIAIFITLLISSLPSIKEFGVKFLYSSTWDPVFGEFGALPFLVGTLLASFLALAISIPFSLAISLFLGEYFKDSPFSSIIRSLVELLAGIPSVIYGFWGLFFLVPLVRSLQMALGIAPYGVGIFTASVILAVMIIPYSASMGREVISMVPSSIKEAAYSLGATRYEVIKKVTIPYAKSGIFAGVLLALGRALGETMAVTMVIGNSNFLPKSIFAPGNTMASLIANEFTEAVDDVYLSALIEIGLILFVVTMLINLAGKQIIKKMGEEVRGGV